MKSKQLIHKDIELLYTRVSEETRLDEGMGIFEFERTQSLIEKYIPGKPSQILDVGGGTGKYSEWLAKKGHAVHLIDPVLKHIKLAQKRAKALKNGFTVHLGESQQLGFPNNFADVVILHGPLYHLQKLEDRIKTIQEAKRILRKDGIILGFAINYTASTLVGLLHGLIHKKSFFAMCKEELTFGLHNPPDEFPWLLARAYYHRPEAFKKEFIGQKLTFLNLYAVEGMAWLDKDYFANLSNPKYKKNLLGLIEVTQHDPYLLPFSPHMMIAVRKRS
ncbi:MAG: class I SAM-dependent methyltransferase [Bacteroidota bacterium]